MPVRLLNSPVLKWPNDQVVKAALYSWVEDIMKERSDVIRIGYLGSYARGDSGVGSDLDLLILVEKSNLPFGNRSKQWDTTDFPVPVDIFVYTLAEFDKLLQKGGFGRVLQKELKWVSSDIP